MAINQNHLFEELNGVKCAIVEKNVVPARVEFLRGILAYNGFTVVVVASPPPKAAPAAAAAGTPAAPVPAAPGPAGGGGPAATAITAGAVPAAPAAAGSAPATPAPAPETFTVGVTEVSFNPVNAIFGRLLRTPDGHVVTLSYWQQKETTSQDEVPYFEK